MKTSDSNTAMSDEQLIEKCNDLLNYEDVPPDYIELLSRFQKAHEDLKCDVRICDTGHCACNGTGNILEVLKSCREDHARLQQLINSRPAPSDIVEKCVEAVIKSGDERMVFHLDFGKLKTALRTVLNPE